MIYVDGPKCSRKKGMAVDDIDVVVVVVVAAIVVVVVVVVGVAVVIIVFGRRGIRRCRC